MAMKGPLAPWAPGMAERLMMLGYRPRLVERHLHPTRPRRSRNWLASDTRSGLVGRCSSRAVPSTRHSC